MREIDHPTNPFPGLRAFESSETHLFFGRDGQSEELLRRLRRTRFLAVVGTSGSGKSSLVRAGLLPALQGGLMASAGSDWRIAILRPGSDPIGNLARALASPAVLGAGDKKSADMQAAMAETTLRRSSLGLVDLVTRARTKLSDSGQPLFADYENLLVVVDQFEELFRFKQLIEEENSQEDAACFVRLLLEAVRQNNEQQIYVVLTMRSDFLGDCAQFFELPEAINNGQYLIPRMTRDERRAAISGPVAVGQGTISEPLVNQLLNDVGDNPDQLPILQHALMRTWDHWLSHRNGNPIDIPDYDAIGGMAAALSRHADEAYAELNDRQQAIAEKLFKGLTEKGADNREIRRPMEVQEICALTGADEAAVVAVVEVFRREGRSFLMPPPNDPLTGAQVHLNGESLIDISHESLIRNWERLKSWVDEESRSARIYRRLAETAVLHKEGGAGLWRDPDLGVALTWREQSNPNPVWAKRYHPEFPLAMSFLDASVAARDAQTASEEARRRKEIKRTRITALVCIVGFLISTGMGVLAYSGKKTAEKAREETKAALDVAKKDRERALKAQENAEEQKRLAVFLEQETSRQKDAADTLKNEASQRALEAEQNAEAAELAKNEARQNENIAVGAAKEAIKQIEKNRRFLYASNIGVAQEALDDQNPERAQTLLRGLIYDPTKDFHIKVGNQVLKEETGDLRGYEWYYLWEQANRKLATLKLTEETQSTKPAAANFKDNSVTPLAGGLVFLTGSSDKIARLWQWGFNLTLEKFPPNDEPIEAVAVGQLKKDPIFAIAGHTKVEIRTYARTPNGFHYVSDVVRTIKLKGNSEHIALAFSPHGKYLAVGDGATFRLWDTGTDKEVLLANGDQASSSSVIFLADGKTLITCDGKKLTRWNLETFQPHEITMNADENKKSEITSIAFTSDGRTMVTNGDRSFMVWTAANEEGTAYQLMAELPAHKDSEMLHTRFYPVVALSPDGKRLATGDGTDLKNGGGVKLWDLTSSVVDPECKQIGPGCTRLRELFTLVPDVEDATSLAFSEDGKKLAVGGHDSLQFWDVSSKEQSTQFAPAATMILAPEKKLVFPDEKLLVTVTADDLSLRSFYADTKLTLPLSSFDQATAKLSGANPGDKNIPIAIEPDGNLLVTQQGKVLRIWDVKSPGGPELQATISGDVSGGVAFSPDGKTIATAPSVDIVQWWSVDKDQSRTIPYRTLFSQVRAMAFSPDGKILAVGGGSGEETSGLVTLWNAETHQLLAKQIRGHEGVGIDVTSLAFSPANNRILAVGGSDKTVELWDVSTGKLITPPFEGHKLPITSVAYSPDGRTIASADSSGVVNLWSASTYQWMVSLKASANAIRTVAFSENGEILLTEDVKGEIREFRAARREQVD